MKRTLFILFLFLLANSISAQTEVLTPAPADSAIPIVVMDSGLTVTEYAYSMQHARFIHYETEILSSTDTSITFSYAIGVDWCQDPVFSFTFDVDSAGILRITLHRHDEDFAICQGVNAHSYTVTCLLSPVAPEIKGIGFEGQAGYVLRSN